MAFLLWLLAGFAGAAVGGAAWVLIGYYTQHEIGWVAWGIGLLAGLAVRKAAGERSIGAGPGMAALTAAFAAVIISKYLVVMFMVDDAIVQNQAFLNALVENLSVDNPDETIGLLAGEIAEKEYEAVGKPVNWPEPADEDAPNKAFYPPEIWQEAETRWNALTPTEREAKVKAWKAERQALIAFDRDEMIEQVFLQSFGGFDLLFFGLAMFTAYRVGSGVDGAQLPPQAHHEFAEEEAEQGQAPAAAPADGGPADGGPADPSRPEHFRRRVKPVEEPYDGAADP